MLYLYYIIQAIGYLENNPYAYGVFFFTLPRLDVFFFLFNIILCPQHNHNLLLYRYVAVKSRRTRHNNDNIPPSPYQGRYYSSRVLL